MTISNDVRLVTGRDLHVPDPESDDIRAALRAVDVGCEIRAWCDDSVDWGTAAITILRSTWDYPRALAQFLPWLDRCGAVTSLWNPPAAVRWNHHKGYLLEVQGRGVAIVPTVLLERGRRVALQDVLGEQRWTRAVIKPAVSLAAHGTLRVQAGDDAGQVHLDALLATGDALVQPYVESIESKGEISLILIDGRPSHAVRKRPGAGDFRVQYQYGGYDVAVPLSAAMIALAEAALACVGSELLYARVDAVEIDGRPHLTELELIEPHLFLEHDQGAMDRLVTAIRQRL